MPGRIKADLESLNEEARRRDNVYSNTKCKPLVHGRPKFYDNGPYQLFGSGFQAASGKITVSGTTNCTKYFIIF
jgi:hypothetical protein